MSDWLEVQRGTAPVVVAFPHGGSDLAGLDARFGSPWRARRDADWHIAALYDFVRALDVTTVATRISRAVIDVNRDPSGASLYPGQATTELCPTTTFDGDPLYAGVVPDVAEVAARRARWFDPYHAALAAELARLRAVHPRVVLYDAHSIRSHIPRLFAGELPQFNLGTNDGLTCASELERMLAEVCASSGHSFVRNGRFKGGWTTRHYGAPQRGVHAVQLELAMRGYLTEPAVPTLANWPAPLHPAPPIALTLHALISACQTFAEGTA